MNPSAPPSIQLFQALPNLSNGAMLLGLGVKAMFLLGLGFFIIFGIVMVRQIGMMSKSLETALTPLLYALGFAYLAFAILVWLFAFVTL